MNYICVFCGSSSGTDPVYRRVAEAMGKAIVQRGFGLVYGGGKVGLMGKLADAVLAAGGEAIEPTRCTPRSDGNLSAHQSRKVD